jgi:hypothetical protein
MKAKVIWVLSICASNLCVLAGGCRRTASGGSPSSLPADLNSQRKPIGGAKLEVSIKAPLKLPIDGSEYHVTLTNQSDYDLWVNARMLDSRVPGQGEQWLDIAGPTGFVDSGCHINPGLLEAKHYQILRPGRSVSGWGALDCYYLNAPGSYTIVAHYHDQNPNPPPAPAGAVYLSEEFQSIPIEVQVLP